MHELAFLAGIEALLAIALTIKLREMRRLEKEIHRTVFDLALACTLASKGRFEEAHASARRWHERMRALKRGKTYRPPAPPPQADLRTKLH